MGDSVMFYEYFYLIKNMAKEFGIRKKRNPGKDNIEKGLIPFFATEYDFTFSIPEWQSFM